MRSIFSKVWVPVLILQPWFSILHLYILYSMYYPAPWYVPLLTMFAHVQGCYNHLVVTRAGHATVFRTIFATVTMQKIPSLCTSSKALHKSDCPGNKVAAIMKKYNYNLIRMCILSQSLGMI